MILPIGYYFIKSIPADAGRVGFQSSSAIGQHAVVITAFVWFFAAFVTRHFLIVIDRSLSQLPSGVPLC